MIFTETELQGAFVIEPERIEDKRGFFARTWCQREFDERGLAARPVQCSISFNKRRGTVRGMHYQAEPCEETKLVRCTMGAIYDVIIDLRPGSPTYKKWVAVELTAENRALLYIPEGFAHGFQTLMNNVEVAYQMSEFHASHLARGWRYDDPAFAIHWPLPVGEISERDKTWPLFKEMS